MKLSKKSDYALRAIFTLAGSQDRPVSIRVMAKRNDIPRRFLEQIMLEMREQGWVRSVAGRQGGYLLARDPADLTMGEVVRHFDGILSPIGCLSVTEYQPCSQEAICRFRRILLEIRNYTVRLMDRATIAAVAAGEPVAENEVFEALMIDGAGI